jgi:putative NADPH-quinone reductase
MKQQRVLVIVGHPQRDKSQLNRELAEVWGDLGSTEIRWIDESPLDVAEEQRAVDRADVVVFQFPLYWYGAPACLKRWLDEVLTWGWAFGPNGGLLGGRRCACSITVGGRLDDYQPEGKHATTLEALCKPMERMAAYVGLDWKGVLGWDRNRMNDLKAEAGLNRALHSLVED